MSISPLKAGFNSKYSFVTESQNKRHNKILVIVALGAISLASVTLLATQSLTGIPGVGLAAISFVGTLAFFATATKIKKYIDSKREGSTSLPVHTSSYKVNHNLIIIDENSISVEDSQAIASLKRKRNAVIYAAALIIITVLGIVLLSVHSDLGIHGKLLNEMGILTPFFGLLSIGGILTYRHRYGSTLPEEQSSSFSESSPLPLVDPTQSPALSAQSVKAVSEKYWVNMPTARSYKERLSEFIDLESFFLSNLNNLEKIFYDRKVNKQEYELLKESYNQNLDSIRLEITCLENSGLLDGKPLLIRKGISKSEKRLFNLQYDLKEIKYALAIGRLRGKDVASIESDQRQLEKVISQLQYKIRLKKADNNAERKLITAEYKLEAFSAEQPFIQDQALEIKKDLMHEIEKAKAELACVNKAKNSLPKMAYTAKKFSQFSKEEIAARVKNFENCSSLQEVIQKAKELDAIHKREASQSRSDSNFGGYLVG